MGISLRGKLGADGSNGDIYGLGREICLRLRGDFRLRFVHLVYG